MCSAMTRICLLIGVFAIGIGSAAAQHRSDSLGAPPEAVDVAPADGGDLIPAPAESSPGYVVKPAPADSARVLRGSGEESDHINVRISTNARNALLFADSNYVGRVPAEYFAVPAQTRQLRLTLEEANTWSVPPIETDLQAAPGDSIEIEMRFPYRYRVESVPFGADVHLERGSEWIFLGSTPLLHTAAEPLKDPLVVQRAGFAVERVSPGSDVWNRHLVMLDPSAEVDPTAAQVDWRPPRQRRAWIDYVALGTAVVAGAVAVHYKFKADDLYATYQETADPALRDDIHAHDVRSGVAFGVMQGGLGLFALRLILR